MGLNIKNDEVETLASEVAAMTGENKTEAIRKALKERKQRLKTAASRPRHERVTYFLQEYIWPHVPAGSSGADDRSSGNRSRGTEHDDRQ